MLHPFRAAAVLILLMVMTLPILLQFEHHDDSPTSHEVNCHGDCGCICHGPTFAIAESDAIKITPRITFATDFYQFPQPSPEPVSVDRPPELNS
jgi:hypothetical protein